MAVIIKINGWHGKDQAKATENLAKVFKMDRAKALSTMQWLAEGRPWKYPSSVSSQQADKAFQYLQKLGFSVELVPAHQKASDITVKHPKPAQTGSQKVSSQDDSRLLELKKGYVFLLILIGIFTLGIYFYYWFLKQKEAFNQLDSDKKFSDGEVKGLFGVYCAVIALFFIIGLTGSLLFLEPFLNLASLGCNIALIIYAFKGRRILLDHMEANYEALSKASLVLTFFFTVLYLQYKINGIHKWHEERRAGPMVLRGDGLAWGMGCLFLIIPIGGILAAIAIPQFNTYKTRAYNSDAKSNLHNIYLACKAFWADNGSDNNCTPEIAKQEIYGYVQSPKVNVSASGTEKKFSAIAYHQQSDKKFIIYSNGRIALFDGTAPPPNTSQAPPSSKPAPANPDGYTAMHFAAMDGDVDKLDQLLSAGGDPGIKSKKGETPLHWAAIKGHEDVAEALLKAGADPNILSGYGPAPIHLAIQYGHKDIIDLLLENGADINIKATNGWTPLHTAKVSNKKELAEYLKSRGAK